MNPLIMELMQRALSPEVDTQNYPSDLDPQLLEVLQSIGGGGMGMGMDPMADPSMGMDPLAGMGMPGGMGMPPEVGSGPDMGMEMPLPEAPVPMEAGGLPPQAPSMVPPVPSAGMPPTPPSPNTPPNPALMQELMGRQIPPGV